MAPVKSSQTGSDNAPLSHTPPPLQLTGERMLPEESDNATFWEHVYRYRFATKFVKGKEVLDIACGEGYGTAAILRAGAGRALGMDVSGGACDHARLTYGIEASCGDAQKIPLPNRSFDVIVSFETIEHLASPTAFLEECVRVLRPGGLLIISTPNSLASNANEEGKSLRQSESNPFHVSEMDENHFTRMMQSYFGHCVFYSQEAQIAPFWHPRSLSVASVVSQTD